MSGISTKAGGVTGSNNQFKMRASDFSYTADGKISKLKLGNGLWEAAKFNERLQITELGLGSGENNPNLWKINYDYGEIESNGTLNASKNTGNIAKQTISFSGLTNPFVQTYKYDSLNRLKEATEKSGAAQTWQQTFSYDRFGNRTNFSQQGGTVAIAQPTIDQTTNRFNLNQGYAYDKNGNVTTDAASGAARTFTFNGENKQTEVRDANGTLVGKYFYDGEGKRVKKQTYDQNGQVKEITVFVYSSGKLIAEYSTAPPPTNPTTNYVATDILESVRAISDANGQITSRRDFMPFGEELVSDVNYRTATRKYSSSEDSIRQKFTGYQKDAETNLDFAEARMYENRQGRFTAVDPLLASGKSANPQTFNRYAYVLGNPIKLTDPTGLQVGCDPTIRGNCQVTTDGSESRFIRQPSPGEILGSQWKVMTQNFGGFGLARGLEQVPIFQPPNLQIPLGRPNDGSFSPGSFEDIMNNQREYTYQMLDWLDTGIRNSVYAASPDYGKLQWKVIVIDIEISMSKDFRFYGGAGTPLGSYGSRTDLNILDSTRPKSFGISAIPSFSVGYFTSGIDGSEDQRAGAMSGGNISGSVPFSPIGLGISKSLPGSGESFLATPTALEIGTPTGGGIGISASDEILTDFSGSLRNHLRKNANFSSRQR